MIRGVKHPHFMKGTIRNMNGIKLASFKGDVRLDAALRVLENAGFSPIFFEDEEEKGNYNGLILPMPSRRFWESEPKRVKNALSGLAGNGYIFLSEGAYFENEKEFKPFKIFDYSKDEDLLGINTIATCEGALALIISNTEYTLRCADVLLTGWGKLAKCLFHMLKKLGANPTVSARSASARAEVLSLGAEFVDLQNIVNPLKKADIIINTIPFPVIKNINHPLSGKLFLELASAPYGYDKKELEALGAKCIFAPALPTRFAPMSSGTAMGRAICRIISQNNII